ncbi:aldose 1-epimerase family protein [Gracilibacillus caseinilyticus]|uniref:Aldose 1-epimerase family protein n=1 Tax=Gracilibacillus caseinilyticus TaxID=2932256 RepID=A0ABY4EVJ0_9BACI|nr:aldose 1-epimerase family protein [Gracilibacillus caseinilyticus]UOQ47669.1 aldose 1-epimerase family protein [Gracilibacillus caseinilyticus]
MALEIQNEVLKVEIAKQGAEIRKVKHMENGLDYMWTGDKTYWGRVSPVLFPIVGRLKEDQYQLNGKTFTMSQHGFLRDVEFEVDKHTTNSISFVFHSDGQFRHMYPYEFTAYIHYSLQGESLAVRWEIINKNAEEMYFSIGAHPAFRLPLIEDETMEDYSLHITPAKDKEVIEYELKDALIHEKGAANDIEEIPLSNSLFKNDALVYSNIDKVKLASHKSENGVEVLFGNFPFVGVWSPYGEDGKIAPFVCIEPWYGIADTYDATGDMKEKLGVQKLKKGETFTSEYHIKFY